MPDFLIRLFSPGAYMPHSHCYLREVPLIRLHVVSDLLIFLSYYSIPLSLVYFAFRRRDLPFNWIFWMFGTFILSCGTTHAMEIVTLEYPVYWLSGWIKAFTAVASVATAGAMVPLVPKALALPSPTDLRRANEALLAARSDLELRVRERTAQLEAVNRELVDTRDEAVRANNEKTRFLANMSHELRTPLNAVIGYSELLAEEAAGDPARRGMMADLQRIRGAGTHLLSMIDDVLDLSRIEAGRGSVAPQEVPVHRIVEDVADAVGPMIARNGNTLHLHGADASAGIVYTDPVKLRQILLNLLSNAAKFTKEGRIDLTVRRTRALRGTGGLPVADTLVFEVSDTGRGIGPEDRARLFEKFFQAGHVSASAEGGTGLGLSISLALTKLLGGEIEVESELGQGSTFRVRIPASYTAPAAAPADGLAWGG